MEGKHATKLLLLSVGSSVRIAYCEKWPDVERVQKYSTQVKVPLH